MATKRVRWLRDGRVAGVGLRCAGDEEQMDAARADALEAEGKVEVVVPKPPPAKPAASADTKE